MQRYWLVFAKYFARRDAEDKLVPDLPGRSCDRDFNRRSHIILYPQISADSRRFFTQGAKGALSSIEQGTARSTLHSACLLNYRCRPARSAPTQRQSAVATAPILCPPFQLARGSIAFARAPFDCCGAGR